MRRAPSLIDTAYDETERFLQQAQEEISRSFHELVNIGLRGEPERSVYVPLRRRKSAVELTGLTGKHSFSVSLQDIDHDRPVLRRRRFTRRQRKSVQIEPDTGVILARGVSESESEEEEGTRQRRSSSIRRRPVRSMSASATVLSAPREESDSPKEKNVRPSFRGPAARRVNRRAALKSSFSQHAQSTADLSTIHGPSVRSTALRYQKRAMSVRCIDGKEIDFASHEDVTRWTSQILAELDSLPSSRCDLRVTEERSADPIDTRRRSADREDELNGNVRRFVRRPLSNFAPPVPPHRPPPPSSTASYASLLPRDGDWAAVRSADHFRSADRLLMTASLCDPLSDRLDSSQQSIASVPQMGPRMMDSFSSASGSSAILDSDTESDDDGTPRVLTPEPADTADRSADPIQRSADRPATVRSTRSRSIGCQYGGSTDTLNDQSEEKEQKQKEQLMRSSLRPEVKLRGDDPISLTDSKLLNSIARLTRSVYGDVRECARQARPTPPQRLSVCPTVWKSQAILATEKEQEQGQEQEREQDPLSQWKHRAQCRGREFGSTAALDSPPSVSGVISSLIRAAEASRLNAIGELPPTLPLSPGQDVGTQTSPASISRSSSFDWINDASELAAMATPPIAPPPLSEWAPPPLAPPTFREPCALSSSDDTADELAAADLEIMSMTRAERTASRLVADIDESIAMLLECAQSTVPRDRPMDVAPCSDAAPRAMSHSVYDNMPAALTIEDPSLSRLEERSDTASVDRSSERSSKLPSAAAIIDQLIDQVPTQQTRLLAFPTSRLTDRAGSCEQLSADHKNDSDSSSNGKLQQAERDAVESCEWLIQAGFPQYARQYQEKAFPIELSSVQADHSFLDADSLAALFKRLHTLNRAAIMRTDNVVLRRRNDMPAVDAMYMEDEDDQVALSARWRYQRGSHTWSRLGNEQMYGAAARTVSTKPNWEQTHTMDRRPDRLGLERTDRAERQRVLMRGEDEESTSSRENAKSHRSLQRSQSERIKDRAKAIMKKMDIRSSSRRRKPVAEEDRLVIGDPVLVSYDSASPEVMRMGPRGHRQQEEYDARMGRSKNARRQGVVMLSPSSPSSPESPEEVFRSRRFRDASLDGRALHRVGGGLSRGRERSVPPPMLHYIQPKWDRDDKYRPEYAEYLYPRERPSLRESRPPPPPPSQPSAFQSRAFETPRRGGAPMGGACAPDDYYGNPYYSPYADSSNYSPAPSSSTYSTPYSTPRSPYQQRRLIVGSDGYYMHDMSPDCSLIRRAAARNMSPPQQNAVAQLRIDTMSGKVSQSSLETTDDEPVGRQRRDSGVGSSLSRSPSGPSTHRIRQSVLPLSPPTSLHSSATSVNSWQTAKRKAVMTSSLASIKDDDSVTFFSESQLLRCVDGVGVMELAKLRKLAYLRVTAILEKHMGAGATVKIGMPAVCSSGPAGRNWTVQKLINKIKSMDSKGKEEASGVFGQPLENNYRRTGYCLPRTILEVLRFLSSQSAETVGLFRKNGVRSRIAELRVAVDRESEGDVFTGENALDGGQVHDVADLLKQYLRELPEPLMTARMSECFAHIYQHVPEHDRLSTLQYAVLLLPDEHREALQTLLFFLHDVARHSTVNNMPAKNLAVCFTPSLFQLSASRLNTSSPQSARRRHKTVGGAGMPSEKEMREARAAQECLTHMIDNCTSLFVAPEVQASSSTECGDDRIAQLNELPGGPRQFLLRRIDDVVKEHQSGWRGWSVDAVVEGVEVSSRKADTSVLRAHRVVVDIHAPPRDVLIRLLNERSLWDASCVNWRSVECVEAADCEVFQYVLNDTLGHPTRDCNVVRLHRIDVVSMRGACALSEFSVQPSSPLGGIPARVDATWLIEPREGRSRLVYTARTDLRGRSASWYNKVYGCQMAQQMIRLRDSFAGPHGDGGPETKV